MNNCLLCEQPDETGGYLCPGCTKSTRVWLEAMPVLYRGLGVLLAPSAGAASGRSGRGGPPPLPVALDVLDARGPGGMVAVLESWVDAVRAERKRPECRHLGGLEGRVQLAADALLRHMPWIAVSWPEAGEFAAEIRELARGAATMIRPPVPERGTRIGHCPAVYENGTLCGAVLRLAPGERVVKCEWCGCSYPPATWAGLKVLIDQDAKSA